MAEAGRGPLAEAGRGGLAEAGRGALAAVSGGATRVAQGVVDGLGLARLAPQGPCAGGVVERGVPLQALSPGQPLGPGAHHPVQHRLSLGG